ncbi:MAG: hypothetical protein H6908_02455 [Hyphomicrobiales bacterium]|nr:hypothetical protein [Rickettsiales bacterium]MCP5361493.1 hypothetical protein [Hyphomicrobiales bacterium]
MPQDSGSLFSSFLQRTGSFFGGLTGGLSERFTGQRIRGGVEPIRADVRTITQAEAQMAQFTRQVEVQFEQLATRIERDWVRRIGQDVSADLETILRSQLNRVHQQARQQLIGQVQDQFSHEITSLNGGNLLGNLSSSLFGVIGVSLGGASGRFRLSKGQNLAGNLSAIQRGRRNL